MGDHRRLGELMDENFDLRLALYGKEQLGAESLEMIELACGLGLPAKFPGSGGSICGLLMDPEVLPIAQAQFAERGYVFKQVHPVEKAEGSHEEFLASLQQIKATRRGRRKG